MDLTLVSHHTYCACANEPAKLVMQRELSVAASTGTRGGGRGDRSFLNRNAGKMTTTEAKHENLSKATATHHTCPEDAEHGGI